MFLSPVGLLPSSVSSSCSGQSYKTDLGAHLRSLQPLFTKLAKTHISAQFLVMVYVLGWCTYFETQQVLFSLCFQEKGVKTLNDIHELLLKMFCIFFAF